MTIGELLDARARGTPDVPALLAPGAPAISYGKLAVHVAEISALLDSIAVARDRAVAVVLPNGIEMAQAFLGIASRAVCAPLNPGNTAAELDFYFEDLDPVALVSDGSSQDAEAVATARGLPILKLGDGSGVDTSHRSNVTPAHPDDIALVLHTSGTTSRPKQVPLTHANLCASAGNVAVTLELTTTDRCLNVMPLFHIHGLVAALLASLHAGGSVVCMPGFDGASFLERAHDTGATWYTAVPTMHQAVLGAVRAAASGPLPNFRFIRSSSAALPPSVLHELEAAFGAPVIEAYGMTEAAHQMASNPLPPRPRKPGSVGSAAGPDVAVMAPDGTLVAPGAVGEIVIRGPNVTAGYLANPEANATAFTDGWFRTGDQGQLDDDGYLTITGRLKEIINRGGEKISPREVDEALLDHPAVAQAVCFAVPHPTLGEDVAAAVVLRDREVEPDALRRFVAERLSAHKVPHRILVLDELPKGPTGKLQRIGLADRLGLVPAVTGQDVVTAHYYATPLEAALAGLWAHVLGVPSVGVADDFLDLGGDSLSAVLLLADVQDVFGVALSATAPFEEARTVELMAGLVASIRDVTPTAVPEVDDVETGASLLPAQEGVWFLDALTGRRAADNAVIALRLSGRLDVPALAGALDELVSRHDALRTTYPAGADGRPDVVVNEHIETELVVEPVVDVDAARARAAELVRQRLDLLTGPVFDARLLRVDPEEHVFVLVAHHVVMDDWSRGVLRNELAASYEARLGGHATSLAPVLGAAALAARRRRRFDTGDLDADLEYWDRTLLPVPEPLDLAGHDRRAAVLDLQGERLDHDIDAELREQLVRFGREQRSTLFMVLLAGFVAMVRRASGSTDFVVAVPTSGRTDRGSESVVGLLANPLPVRVDSAGDPTFTELVARVRAACLGAYAHQEVPFERLVERLPAVRHANRRPLAQVAFQLRNLPPVTNRLGEAAAEDLDLHPGTAVNDLAVEVTDRNDHLEFTFEYPDAMFDAATVGALAADLEAVLIAGMTTPDAPLSKLAPDPTDTEAAGERDPAPATPDGSVHDWFVRQVRTTPDAVAVLAGGEQITYRMLDERSNQLARHLGELGAAPGRTVGILVGRDEQLPVVLLAVLKAGAAFVPLDPDHPPARLGVVLETADPVVIVTDRTLRARVPDDRKVVVLDDDEAAIREHSAATLDSPAGPRDLAYVMFTSGSTGRPKGVMIEHGSLAQFFAGFRARIGLGQHDVVLASTPLTFDPSIRELLLPLTCGGRVVITPRPLALDPSAATRLIATAGVTVVQGTPTTLGALLDAGWHPDPTVTAWSCGERLPGALAEQVLRSAAALWNLYGPTESTQCATVHRVIEVADNIPIGRPLPGVTIELVGDGLEPVPRRAIGEIVISGSGVGRGYLGADESAFLTGPAGRRYRTGDFARRCADGTFEFVGRRDHQLKVRGVRIELDDVAGALRQQPGVHDAVADVRNERIVAWVVPVDGVPVVPEAVRRGAASLLPPSAVPAVISVVDAFPLTPTGKLDRRALSEPVIPERASAAADAPATVTEVGLAEIWDELLEVEGPVMRCDDFFLLGGHSLLAIELAHDVEERFGVDLPLAQLFETPTLEMLARRIDDLRSGGGDARSAPAAAVVLRPGDADAPICFIVPGVWGSVLGLRKSAVLMDPPYPVVGFEAPGHRGGPAFVSVEDQAMEYLGAVEELRPSGPVVIGGFSFGGFIAFEMASRLVAAGRDVHLVLVDPRPPLRPGEQPPPRPRLRWSNRLRRVRKILRHPRVPRHEAATVQPALRKRPNLRLVIEGNGRARSQYRCQARFVGTLTLIASESRSAAEYEEGWRPFVDGPIDTRLVPGRHVELLDEPASMEAVIEIFNEVLQNTSSAPAEAAPRP